MYYYGAMGRAKEKRKRGAQPGNRNARRHGFYAAGLTEMEVGRVWDAIANDGLAPELAVLRVKLDAALGRGPASTRLRRDAARLLTRFYATRCGLDEEGTAAFRRFLRVLLGNVRGDGTNPACSTENCRKMTKRTEAEKPVSALLPASAGCVEKGPFSRNESASERVAVPGGAYPPEVCGKATSV